METNRLKKIKANCTTFYIRNAGFTSKNEYLSSNKLYGKLKGCTSKPRTTHILPLAGIEKKQPFQKKDQY
jgi:hypothetical protein